MFPHLYNYNLSLCLATIGAKDVSYMRKSYKMYVRMKSLSNSIFVQKKPNIHKSLTINTSLRMDNVVKACDFKLRVHQFLVLLICLVTNFSEHF